MKSARVIYHLARADFLERVRRYSFLVMLGLAALLGYQTAIVRLNFIFIGSSFINSRNETFPNSGFVPTNV